MLLIKIDHNILIRIILSDGVTLQHLNIIKNIIECLSSRFFYHQGIIPPAAQYPIGGHRRRLRPGTTLGRSIHGKSTIEIENVIAVMRKYLFHSLIMLLKSDRIRSAENDIVDGKRLDILPEIGFVADIPEPCRKIEGVNSGNPYVDCDLHLWMEIAEQKIGGVPICRENIPTNIIILEKSCGIEWIVGFIDTPTGMDTIVRSKIDTGKKDRASHHQKGEEARTK